MITVMLTVACLYGCNRNSVGNSTSVITPVNPVKTVISEDNFTEMPHNTNESATGTYTSAPEITGNPVTPTETPEITAKPTKTPEITAKPTKTPEITAKPTKTPEITAKPTKTPEITAKPSATPVKTYVPDSQLPLSGITVCIDAGHQRKGNSEKEPCAPWSEKQNSSVNINTLKAKVSSGTDGVKTKTEEYVVNLSIALKVRKLLESYGADVFMIRETNDVNISNRERALLTNSRGCDITINIHCNGSSNADANGIECYVRDKGDNSPEYKKKSDYDYSLALKLLSRVTEATGAKSRGAFRSDSYTGINWREKTVIILECGFMSNVKEDALLASDSYQQKIADGILGFFLKDYIEAE